MTLLTDAQLLKYNQEGLIPGPGEPEEAFAGRAAYCTHLKEHFSAELIKDFSINQWEDLPNLQVKEFDIAPKWIPIFFSDYRLPFWHGGCAWIFQISEDKPTAALIQLRQKFRSSSSYLGIYSREELLTHELVHVGRMMYQEPKFEEIFAYNTSKNSFRRTFGAIIQSSMESVIFVLLLGLIVVFDVFLVAMQRVDAYLLAFWLKLIPAAFIAVGLIRLFHRQRTLRSCIDNLQEITGSVDKAKAIAFRLADKEISAFSSSSPEEILSYIDAQAPKELRWRLIRCAYL